MLRAIVIESIRTVSIEREIKTKLKEAFLSLLSLVWLSWLRSHGLVIVVAQSTKEDYFVHKRNECRLNVVKTTHGAGFFFWNFLFISKKRKQKMLLAIMSPKPVVIIDNNWIESNPKMKTRRNLRPNRTNESTSIQNPTERNVQKKSKCWKLTLL